jgi:hypothetical protein
VFLSVVVVLLFSPFSASGFVVVRLMLSGSGAAARFSSLFDTGNAKEEEEEEEEEE